MSSFDPTSIALILVDLQNGVVRGEKEPRSGDEVVQAAKRLAARFRAAGAPVVLAHVGFRSSKGLPSLKVDKPSLPSDGTPEEFYEIVDRLRQEGDIVAMKHRWGAFTGADLDLQFRRRGVRTVVIGGIATNFGVESTARSAWELSYDVVIVEDVTTSRSAALHAFAIETFSHRSAES
jgi:nicotinamidase-related amidase